MAKKQEYNLQLKIYGNGLSIELKGKVNAQPSELEKIAEKADMKIEIAEDNKKSNSIICISEPSIITRGKRPELTKELGYHWLDKGKDYDWFRQRYNCTKQQVAAYKAWNTMRDD